MLLCCSVLQCVAVCCSVLQCVAVCNSVLQCAKRRYSVVGLAQQSDMGRQRYIGSLISKVSFAREPCEIGLVWMTTSSSRIARPKERTIRHYRKIAILRGVCECVLHATPFPPTPLALPHPPLPQKSLIFQRENDTILRPHNYFMSSVCGSLSPARSPFMCASLSPARSPCVCASLSLAVSLSVFLALALPLPLTLPRSLSVLRQTSTCVCHVCMSSSLSLVCAFCSVAHAFSHSLTLSLLAVRQTGECVRVCVVLSFALSEQYSSLSSVYIPLALACVSLCHARLRSLTRTHVLSLFLSPVRQTGDP